MALLIATSCCHHCASVSHFPKAHSDLNRDNKKERMICGPTTRDTLFLLSFYLRIFCRHPCSSERHIQAMFLALCYMSN
uniref:Uncharacterized protein n=1 Tax=Ixodes ricinus TaxID=34613 RepID=A0A6B0TVK7_IXORI